MCWVEPEIGSDDIFTIESLKYPIKVTGSVFDASTGKELTGVRVLMKQDEPASLPDQQMLTELYGAYRFEGRSQSITGEQSISLIRFPYQSKIIVTGIKRDSQI